VKILYAVHGYKPAYRVGGPILSVAAAAEQLVRRGHEVTVFTSNSNLDEDLDVPLDQPVNVDGVQVYYFRREEPLKRWFPSLPYLSQSMGFLYLPNMNAELERILPQTDVVHTHMPFVYPTYAAGRAAIAKKVPLFYHQRGVFDPARLHFRSLKKRVYIKYVEAPILRRATTLIALTDAEVASYKALGIQTPCRVIPNGIDVAPYLSGDASKARAKWKIPHDAKVILFLGRIHPIKGADRLLRAFLKTAPKFKNAVLVLAGPDEWNLRAKFAEEVATAGLADRVIFPGMVVGADKLDLLASADIFSLPSDAEGFSMAVLEALASSTAVLLSPGCHFPETEAAGCGYIAGLAPEEIAAKLELLLSNTAALSRMGTVGRDFVLQNYDWSSVIDRFLEAYQEGIHRVKSTGAEKRAH
jgi:glycosyltransferase involved in cell wall biosynthesis